LSQDAIDLTVAEAAGRIAAGELTSEALVRACLDRIAAREDAVVAWAHLDPDQALAAARAADAVKPEGALHGVPIAVKDIFDTCDMPTEYGSPIYAGHRPVMDSACVALLRRAGAVLLGKTHTTEFAALHPAPTRNPHNPDFTPGGSSAGSAAAVADRMAPAATGTQTFGSVVRPAAFCGVVGFKPTFGTISRGALKPQAETLDTVGTFSRSVADVPVLMGALTGTDARAFSGGAPDTPRVGVIRGPGWDKAQPETAAAIDSAAAALADAGMRVEALDVPALFEKALDAHFTLGCFEIARSMAHERRVAPDKLSQELSEMVEVGEGVPMSDYRAAVMVREAAAARLAAIFGDHDVLLTASAPGEAPRGLGGTGNPVFNRFWTFLHVPCITLPCGTGPNGLPTAVQLVGPLGGDVSLIAIARAAETALA
jgi:Asp-tRNA(Asn)/Glu-tRNA(Gln) amidotransferase A subunit family amidase